MPVFTGGDAMPDSTACRLSFQNGIIHDSISIKSQTTDHLDSPPSVGVLHPTVKITRAKSAIRLGTGWHWWFSESVHIPIGNKVEFRFLGCTHLLVMYDEGRRRDGETSIDGLSSSRLRSFVHKLTFVPAGRAYREWHETGASTRVTFIYLNPTALGKSAGVDDALQPRIYFEDHLVWETASKLKTTIESGQDKCMPYLEAISAVLAHELSRVDQSVVRQPEPCRGGLAGWQKRVVIDHIAKHLGEQICLLKLAELAELSLHHFCRAFKQSFGIPPHQYQVQRRMEAAKLLLVDRATSVTDIALTLGYAQISSFSCAFRKMTGWTPTVYRRVFKGPNALTYANAMHAPSSAC
jgi:AraC family transcriptional regulator